MTLLPSPFGRFSFTLQMVSISAALFCILAASCAPYKGEFLIINEANETIKRAIVSVCGQTIELKGLQPTQKAFGLYDVKSDSHYAVTVEFESGRKLQKDVGYVTSGLDFHDKIVVTDKDILIVGDGAHL